MERHVSDREAMEAFAGEFVRSLVPGAAARVVALSGDLGAGKTAFAQGVAKALGVREVVTSPTFVIEKVYDLEAQGFGRLIHIDAYRLDGAEELRKLGWDTIVADPENLILIEWPERVPGLLPGDARTLSFAHGSGDERIITYG